MGSERLIGTIAAVVVVLLTLTPQAVAGGPPIAFDRDGDLYTFRVGGHPHRVTATPAREHDPAWSPEHRRLAFALWDRRIGTLDLRSGARRTVARLPRRIDRIETLAWSPDGDLIAVAATNEFTRSGSRTLSGTIWTVRPDGGGLDQVLTGQGMVTGLGWSPDGGRLYASTEWPNGVELWRPDARLGVIAFDPDGTDLRSVVDTLASHLDVAEDGRRIAYRGWSRTCHACGEIWRMAADGSGAHVIAMPPEGIAGLGSPRFSPAGTRVAVTAWGGPRSSMWVMRADGSRLRRVLTDVGDIDW